MSSSSSNANPNHVPAVEHVVGRTTFEVNGRPVTIEDIVMDNEDIAVAVARDMMMWTSLETPARTHYMFQMVQ